jgi:hypothetical protein
LSKKRLDGQPKLSGRPKGTLIDFNDVMKTKILELAESGKTDKEIAREVGCSERALNYWKRKNVNLCSP